MTAIRLSRVYDHDPRAAGKPFLVERLWPRGIRRDGSRGREHNNAVVL